MARAKNLRVLATAIAANLAVCTFVLILVAQPSEAASSTVSDIANPDAYSCPDPTLAFLDFEDLPDGTNLSSGAFKGVQFTTTGGFTWLVGDFATGRYAGKYPLLDDPDGAYTSKGTHWAWLGRQQGTGRIDFVNGKASEFSLLVSANDSPVSLDAYDENDNLLATAGPTSSDFNTGHMDELRITRDTADIAYVIVHDTGNLFLIDAICTDAPDVSSNKSPMADAGGPYDVDEGSSVQLSGSGTDDDGTVAAYAWDLDNDGSFETPRTGPRQRWLLG